MINDYLPTPIGWTRFILTTAIVVIAYLLIKELITFFLKTEFAKKRRILSRNIQSFIRLFEPVLVIIILILFIRVNPITHSIILFLLMLLSFGQLRDYVGGIIFHLSKSVQTGTHMAIGDSKGIVSAVRRLGLDLQTSEGDEFVPYSQIVKHHKFLVTDNIKGLVQIRFKTIENQVDLVNLKNKLSAVPYIDWSINPKFDQISEQEANLELRLSDTAYLKQLKLLLGEQGYTIIN